MLEEWLDCAEQAVHSRLWDYLLGLVTGIVMVCVANSEALIRWRWLQRGAVELLLGPQTEYPA